MPKYSPAELARIVADPNGPQLAQPPAPTVRRRHKRYSAWESEHEFQQAVVEEAELLAMEYPAAGLLYAVPNGQYRQGQRKEAGMRRGVPDLCLPVARHGYHGLYIELKVAKGRLSEAQEGWLVALTEQGYLCRVIVEDLSKARELLRWYLAHC